MSPEPDIPLPEFLRFTKREVAYVVLACMAIAAIVALAGCSSDDHDNTGEGQPTQQAAPAPESTGSESPPAIAESSSSPASPATSSAVPQPTVNTTMAIPPPPPGGYPTTVPAPEPEGAAPGPGDVAAALKVASDWTSRFVGSAGKPPEAWRKDVAALTTPESVTMLDDIDPRNIPMKKVTGPAKQTYVGSETVEADVPTDKKPIHVVVVENTPGTWLISDWDHG